MEKETPTNGWKCGDCGEEIEVTPLTFVNPHICKETPDEKYEITNDREFDKVKDDYCPRCMFEDDITALRSSCKHAPHNQKHGLATPTEECPDCRCTDLVSDRCKGECVCHHPELPPTVEEWGEIADKIEELYQSGMYDADFRKKLIINTLTSHDAKWQQHEHDMYESLEKAHKEELAELRRKIEGIGFSMHVTEYLEMIHKWDKKDFDTPFSLGYEQAKKDVLALFTNKTMK